MDLFGFINTYIYNQFIIQSNKQINHKYIYIWIYFVLYPKCIFDEILNSLMKKSIQLKRTVDFKEIVSAISSDPSCRDGNTQFTAQVAFVE